MKIAYYITNYYPIMGGTTTRLYNTFVELTKMGHEAILITPQTDVRPVGNEAIHSIKHFKVPLGFDKISYSFGHITSYPDISRIIRCFQPDIVHIIINFPIDPGLLYVFLAGRFQKKKIIVSYLTHLERYIPFYFNIFSPMAVFLLRRFLQAIHIFYRPILVSSHFMRRYFASLGIRQTAVWLPGISRMFFENQGLYPKDNELDQDKKIIYAGRLEPEKNIHQLLELITLLRKVDQRYKLTICGAGNLQSDIIEVEGVTHIGEVDYSSMPSIYSQHEVFITCSDTETLGFTTIEAMARGLIVIAADSGGTQDLIKSGCNGFLFPVDNLTRARDLIINVFNDKGLMKEISDNAVTAAKDYHPVAATKQLVQHYTTVLHAGLFI